MPSTENYKYINKDYRNQLIGEQYAKVKGVKDILDSADDKKSPYLQFVQGALQGKYEDHQVLLGLIDAMVRKTDREERGVGMQNFRNDGSWDEFVHIIAIHSPEV